MITYIIVDTTFLKTIRLFFLSQAEVLLMLSETRDPARVQGHLRHCFTGIHSLEFDDLHEALAMISGRGERIPFSAPIRTKAAKGCVEKWMLQVEKKNTYMTGFVFCAIVCTGSLICVCLWDISICVLRKKKA